MLYLTTCHMAGIKSGSKMSFDHLNELPINTSPDAKNEVEEHQDIDIHDLFGSETPEDDHNVEEKDNVGFDMNVPHTDDEIADVDDSGDTSEIDQACCCRSSFWDPTLGFSLSLCFPLPLTTVVHSLSFSLSHSLILSFC